MRHLHRYIYFFQMPWVPELIFRAQDLATLTQMYRGPKNDVDTYPDEVIEAYKYYFSQDGELWCVCFVCTMKRMERNLYIKFDMEEQHRRE